MSEAPRVLLVTSAGTSPAAVVPVLAAVEGSGLRLRAIDVGRVGARSEGTVERMLRAVFGELAERRLSRELSNNPPDVVVTFDPGAAQALTVARDSAQRPAPVVGVIDALTPEKEWAATDADRFLVVDDEAAVALSDVGVEPERIVTVGPIAGAGFGDAGRQPRAALRSRFGLGGGAVVLVEVGGLGYDTTAQLALQLSLTETDATYLFDAGSDADAASALRRQVPTLGLRAKLFGRSAEAPLYWRCADVVVTRARPRSVARALAVGARMVCFGADDGHGQALTHALEQRGLATSAANALLVTAALDPALHAGPLADNGGRIGADGAGNVADALWIVGSERDAVIEERRASLRAATSARVSQAATAAEAAVRMSAPAGGLEDLSGGYSAPPPEVAIPDAGELARLRAEVDVRMAQVSKTVFAAREAAEQWEKRAEQATRKGDQRRAAEASRSGDAERARMHAALAEMSQLQSELRRLERATMEAVAAGAAPRRDPPPPGPAPGPTRPPPPPRSSLDDELRRMKRQTRAEQARSIEDELAALKKKMTEKKT